MHFMHISFTFIPYILHNQIIIIHTTYQFDTHTLLTIAFLTIISLVFIYYIKQLLINHVYINKYVQNMITISSRMI